MNAQPASPTDAPKIRLLVVDDQPLVRHGLAGLLALEDTLEVVGEASNGAEALELAAELQPDVVLMDIKMPVMTGIEATARLRDLNGNKVGPQVVLLTTFEELDDMVAGVNAGAAGYIFKSAEVDEIVDAITRVNQGERVIHARVATALARRMGGSTFSFPAPLSSVPADPDSGLTSREVEILRALAAGHPNKRIAQQLGITEGTVKIHVSNVLSKLGVGNRTEAANKAAQLGLLGEK